MLSLWIKTTNATFPGSRSIFLNGARPPMAYNIKGATVREQGENIRLMGQYMGRQNGRGELAAHIQDLIEDVDKENFPKPSAFVEYMFGSADEFYLENELVVDLIAEDETLLDALATIGEALALAAV